MNTDEYNINTDCSRFKEDALEDVGLTGHPKAEEVWCLAWQYGHAGGFNDVYNYLGELAELVR